MTLADVPGGIDHLHQTSHQVTHPLRREETQKYLSVNPRGREHACEDAQALRFVRSVLHLRPESRLTATQSLENSIFHCAADFSARAEKQESISPIQEALMKATIAANVKLSVALWRCEMQTDRDALRRLSKRKGKEVPSIHDEYLSKERPVHLLRIGETYCLRLRIESRNGFSVTFDDVIGISVRPPDADAHPLNADQLESGDSVEAFALWPLAECDSDKLNSVSPRFGTPQRKYTEIKVAVQVRVREPPLEICLEEKIHCRMMDSERHLSCYRLYRKIKGAWIALPPISRSFTRCFVSAAEIAAGAA